MGGTDAARVAWEVLRTEGPAAVRDRVLERWAARRRRDAFRTLGRLDVAGDEPGPALPPAPVLHVLPTAPRPDFGGVQLQLLRRLEARPGAGSALLYPEADGFRLEVTAGGERVAVDLRGAVAPSLHALRDAGFERAVERAAGAVAAEALHFEGVAGVPPESVTVLAATRKVVFSIHDFGLFCVRPHLIERPELVFCGFCRDDGRCDPCLRAEGAATTAGFASARRLAAAAALRSVAAAVFPSESLLGLHRGLFPASLPELATVVTPPATLQPARPGPRPTRPLRHLAVVGSVRPHKGSALLEALAARPELAGLPLSIYGGGDRAILAALRRRPGVRVRGYYRAGRLPRLLADDRVDLALLLSIWPETYALTFDECLLAGVPVVAYDHGAIAERARRWGGALLVPPADGLAGIAAAVARVRTGGQDVVPATDPATPIADAAGAAEGWREVYRKIGVVGEGV